MELIERESFMISYLNRLQMPTLKTRDFSENIQKRLKILNISPYQKKDFLGIK